MEWYYWVMVIITVVLGLPNLGWMFIKRQIDRFSNHLSEVRKELNDLNISVAEIHTWKEDIEKRMVRIEDWKNGERR